VTGARLPAFSPPLAVDVDAGGGDSEVADPAASGAVAAGAGAGAVAPAVVPLTGARVGPALTGAVAAVLGLAAVRPATPAGASGAISSGISLLICACRFI
jgi:hypothetical protein